MPSCSLHEQQGDRAYGDVARNFVKLELNRLGGGVPRPVPSARIVHFLPVRFDWASDRRSIMAGLSARGSPLAQWPPAALERSQSGVDEGVKEVAAAGAVRAKRASLPDPGRKHEWNAAGQ